MDDQELILPDDIAIMPFEDWFSMRTGFVGIRVEFNGFAVYEYHAENKIKRHWFMQKTVAYALYDEIRVYLEA
jgi:hypothetical protein